MSPARESGKPAAAPLLSYVVPTLGVESRLVDCLESIYRDRALLDETTEVVIVLQGAAAKTGAAEGTGRAELADLDRRLEEEHPAASGGPCEVVHLPAPVGFARAANEGIATSRGDWVALVNDDVVLEAGWAAALLQAMGAWPTNPRARARSAGLDVGSRIAAAQGVNLLAGSGELQIDGAGLAWNRRDQAIQLGRGEEPPARDAEPRLVYGASATAAIYSRRALRALGGRGEPLRPFDERLHSYYEDVELADRLAERGYLALLVPAARVEHAGSSSSRSATAARCRIRRLIANRLLVVARRRGAGFWTRLPELLLYDLADALRPSVAVPLPGDAPKPTLIDLAYAWTRALCLLPGFARTRPRASAE